MNAVRWLLVLGLLLWAFPVVAQEPEPEAEAVAETAAGEEVETRGLDPRKRRSGSPKIGSHRKPTSDSPEPEPDTGDSGGPPKRPPPKRPTADDGPETVDLDAPPKRPPPRRPRADGDAPEPVGDLAPLPAAPPQRARANALVPRRRTFDPKGIRGPTYSFHMSPRARVIAEGGEGIQPDDRAQLQADRARYQRLKQAIQEAAPDSDDFSFDDTKQQIDFRGNYFQLSQLTRTNLKLRDEFNGLADTHSGEPGVDTRTQFDGAFSSPQYRDARRNQLTAALANARDFDYSAYDTRSGPEAQAALRARMRGTAAQKMRALLDGRDGFIVSETHSDKNPKDLLAKNMDGLKKAGVKTLYLEHFRHGEHQGALDAFNDGGELPDDRTFQRQLNGIPGLKGLLTAARANGVRVVAIDDAIAKADTPNNDGPQRFGVERAARMNFVSADVIDTTRQRPDPGKYVVLIGAKHTNTHEGGIPGMAQILNVPAVRVRPGTGDAPADVELDAENTALRAPPRPPGGGEQAANTGAN